MDLDEAPAAAPRSPVAPAPGAPGFCAVAPGAPGFFMAAPAALPAPGVRPAPAAGVLGPPDSDDENDDPYSLSALADYLVQRGVPEGATGGWYNLGEGSYGNP